ncbi:N-acetylmuramoyl-L-alanine amidase family protein [Paenibacillus sp. chi10]|uniref:N-acetylmuramoyl-L-alanine amidase family protein n=1 Tax=Paenibacillus suaedae TaxID=3077233 RepID=A0AAJ2JY84_9BACL|nr:MULTISPECIES: N-acetylmuramoyl-L-alanine amidase family protein [unclassified Paenibacillus]MDT8979240.1 N-acetylmuramoyl-L-alanine amidase family protein [Paenibacillus sp. chi10]GAV16040.1 N-acetylmuramoyl-L-alanine amidase [Paenibacillus sp. NAIST15-1]
MKKSILFILFSVLFLIALPNHSDAAAKQTKIILDGEECVLPENAEVVNLNNNVMIPIRVVAENLKFKVDWQQKTQNVKIQQNAKVISLAVGKKEALVDNEQKTLSFAPQNIKNTVVVPIRFVSEEMGLKVGWNNVDKIVTLDRINSDSDSPPAAGEESESELHHVNDIQFANNQLVVSLDQEVTPVISQLTSPDRIVVDLPHTAFGGSLAESLGSKSVGKLDLSGVPNVTEVRYSLFNQDPAQIRIVIELNQISNVQYTSEWIEGQLIVDLNMNGDLITTNPDAVLPHSGAKLVVIDPGHGGSDPGTSGYSNQVEKDFTLALSLKVQALLLEEPEIKVVMTRETDVYPTRTERVQLANTGKADVFVSIHGNSVKDSPKTTGTETFYYQRSSSKSLAEVIHRHLIEAIGLKDRGVKNGDLQVIRETTMPAVLLEIGFLSNPEEEAALLSDSFQDKAAQAIVDGIKEYLGK